MNAKPTPAHPALRSIHRLLERHDDLFGGLETIVDGVWQATDIEQAILAFDNECAAVVVSGPVVAIGEDWCAAHGLSVLASGVVRHAP